MSPWGTLVVILTAVNLARVTGRGFLVAQVAMAGLVLAAVFGLLPDVAWWRRVASVIVVGLIVVVWTRWCLGGQRRLLLPGLFVFLAGSAVQFWLLPAVDPAGAGPWLWTAAFLLLAEPTTRGLRWGMGLVGKAAPLLPDSLGRGEAIGVLERWLILVMIARGQYAAMGFIIAAKALARHKRFHEDPEFAEYFLVGTLASVLVALAVAELLRGIGVAAP